MNRTTLLLAGLFPAVCFGQQPADAKVDQLIALVKQMDARITRLEAGEDRRSAEMKEVSAALSQLLAQQPKRTALPVPADLVAPPAFGPVAAGACGTAAVPAGTVMYYAMPAGASAGACGAASPAGAGGRRAGPIRRLFGGAGGCGG